MEYDRSKQDWVDHPTQIWVVEQQTYGIVGATSTQQGAEVFVAARPKSTPCSIKETTLHRPSLRAVYGGPTLIEALWSEMDRLMEGLMTGQDAEDGGDRFRAAELAWVLAIVTNAYDPSVDRIRAEAMERWNAQQQFEAEQEAALNPEEDDFMTRPEGADQ